ncbi:DUF192 domain-containing protein [Patescibacteria group bacterium]|nr:DUF192 domain-containing protein [Patescibacteria group bacterium]
MSIKNIIIILGLFALAVILAYIFSTTVLKNNALFKSSPSATINNHKIKLTVAKSGQEQEIGLSKYTLLPKDEGMIFPFKSEAKYRFWMKNMKFPIDIIYIKNKKVVTVFENAQPPKNESENPPIYEPSETADTVLEINAGLSKEFGIKKGTEIKYENFSN